VISQARFAEVRGKPTDSLAAFEWVLKAAAYYRDNWNATEHAQLRDGLERAVESDPGFADAWFYLCFSYLDEHCLNYNPRPDPLDRALDAARRAVDTGPNMQSPHCALAHVHFFRHDLDAFYAEAERAIALNPNHSVNVAVLGEKMAFLGDERGITLVRRAAKLDPFHPTWFNFSISHYHFERREYEAALIAARKMDIPGYFWPQVHLAAIYAELGRQQEAHSALEQLLNVYPGFTVEKLTEERRKWNATDDSIRRWVAALRKAGLPE
jgi:tetratricopeptide (TPR) repeat protein